MIKRLMIIGLTALTLTGCASIGPKATKQGQKPYNEAIIHTWKEQLLLNLVRLRYRDNPYFLEVSSLTTAYTMSAGFESENMFAPYSFTKSLGIGVKPFGGYEEKPTISYAPVQGEKFVKQMLSPISPEFILILAQSGWDIDRVFDVCVESINNVNNAIGAAGPTPEFAPEFGTFERLGTILQRLQNANIIALGSNPKADEPNNPVLMIRDNTSYQSEIRELYQILNITSPQPFLNLSGNILSNEEDTLRIQPRSLMGAMFFLSQGVEVPVDHENKGYVTVTKNPDGSVFDWQDITCNGISVHCQKGKPKATVRVQYKGHWFYIDDADLSSKTTFMLLSKLFDLQSGQTFSSIPTLTLPVNG